MSAWLLVMAVIAGGAPPIVVPGIESESECHRLAVLITREGVGVGRAAPRHVCIEYFMAVGDGRK
jgi:hypothetical protein